MQKTIEDMIDDEDQNNNDSMSEGGGMPKGFLHVAGVIVLFITLVCALGVFWVWMHEDHQEDAVLTPSRFVIKVRTQAQNGFETQEEYLARQAAAGPMDVTIPLHPAKVAGVDRNGTPAVVTNVERTLRYARYDPVSGVLSWRLSAARSNSAESGLDLGVAQWTFTEQYADPWEYPSAYSPDGPGAKDNPLRLCLVDERATSAIEGSLRISSQDLESMMNSATWHVMVVPDMRDGVSKDQCVTGRIIEIRLESKGQVLWRHSAAL